MPHIWMRHGTHMNESCHTYEWDMAHIWTSHVTHMNETWHTYEWVLPHIWMRHGTHMIESYHTYERDCHSFICVTRHPDCIVSHMWMSLVTHTHRMIHIQTWMRVSFIHMCDTTRLYVGHDSFTCVTRFIQFMSHIWMNRVTHVNESCHTNKCVMFVGTGSANDFHSFICVTLFTSSWKSRHTHEWMTLIYKEHYTIFMNE